MRTVDPTADAARSRAPHDRIRGDGESSRARRSSGRRLAKVLDISDGWETAARCRGEDATLFFGPNRFEPKQERLEREADAKAVCATCPVMASCREHALQTGELYGVWGGLGEADRRALLADRGRIARAV